MKGIKGKTASWMKPMMRALWVLAKRDNELHLNNTRGYLLSPSINY